MLEEDSTGDDFAKLLDESFSVSAILEGSVMKGVVTSVEKNSVVVDVGLKVEGRVPIKEFGGASQEGKISVGDTVDVYLEKIENAVGEAVLSREKARREEGWVRLEEAFSRDEKVSGVIFSQVKGGFTVEIEGSVAFLPQSQVDIRPVRDIGPLMNISQSFKVIKMDKRRGNIIVSRRSVLEATRAEQHSEVIQNLKEGQVIEGVVKNVTGYGAFVDLGGIDGLLHVTDIAWRRINHPTEILSIGQTISVQVMRVNYEGKRVSLGMKQLEKDPWDGVAERYPVGSQVAGVVSNVTDYGAFVELMPGVEGLVHVSEMTWGRKNIQPGQIVATSQEVTVRVLAVDSDKRRISLSLRQPADHPWVLFMEKNPVGSIVRGVVKNKTDFGLFIGLEGDIDGLVHLHNLDWMRPGEQVIGEYNKGREVDAVVLGIDVEKRRLSIGIKQLTPDPLEKLRELPCGSVLACEIIEIREGGLSVRVIDMDVPALFIPQSETVSSGFAKDLSLFSVGQCIDAKIVRPDSKHGNIQLSIRALEMEQEEALTRKFSTLAQEEESVSSLGDELEKALSGPKNTA